MIYFWFFFNIYFVVNLIRSNYTNQITKNLIRLIKFYQVKITKNLIGLIKFYQVNIFPDLTWNSTGNITSMHLPIAIT